MGVDATDLHLTLARLYALSVELDKIEEPAPGDRSKPYPPASEDDILAAEQRLNFSFPPVYRKFLTLHNGWRNFSFDWSIFGVSGPGYDKAARNWAASCAQFAKRFARRDPKAVEALREESKTDPSALYWPDHVPLAVDFNGGFRIYDRNRPSGDGEFEVAEIHIRSEEAGNREQGFLAIIELAFHIARRELREHGRKPESIEQSATVDQLRAAAAGTSAPARPTKAMPPDQKVRSRRQAKGAQLARKKTSQPPKAQASAARRKPPGVRKTKSVTRAGKRKSSGRRK